jgi:hypothetical protein
MILFSCNASVFNEVKSKLNIRNLDANGLNKVKKLSEWDLNGDGYSINFYKYNRSYMEIRSICDNMIKNDQFMQLPLSDIPESMLSSEIKNIRNGIYKIERDNNDKRNFFLLIITFNGDFIYYKQVL